MRWRGLDPVDRLDIDGQAVVMVGDRVLLLSPIATAALDVLAGPDWTSDLHLTEALGERFGLPEDPAGAVFALVNHLVGEGLVEQDVP